MAAVVSSNARFRARFASALSAALLVATVACGGGGGGGGGTAPAAVSIQTVALPTAGVDVPYATSLAATGGSAPYAWSLAPGSALPTGLTLGTNGSISGTANQ